MKLQWAKAFSRSSVSTTSICSKHLIWLLMLIAFLMCFLWEELQDGRLITNHQHQPPLMTTVVVSGKSPQYTTTKGYPWSWIGSVSILPPPLATWQWLCVRVSLAMLHTTMHLNIIPPSAP
jgi:hypothetical protein